MQNWSSRTHCWTEIWQSQQTAPSNGGLVKLKLWRLLHVLHLSACVPDACVSWSEQEFNCAIGIAMLGVYLFMESRWGCDTVHWSGVWCSQACFSWHGFIHSCAHVCLIGLGKFVCGAFNFMHVISFCLGLVMHKYAWQVLELICTNETYYFFICTQIGASSCFPKQRHTVWTPLV